MKNCIKKNRTKKAFFLFFHFMVYLYIVYLCRYLFIFICLPVNLSGHLSGHLSRRQDVHESEGKMKTILNLTDLFLKKNCFENKSFCWSFSQISRFFLHFSSRIQDVQMRTATKKIRGSGILPFLIRLCLSYDLFIWYMIYY